MTDLILSVIKNRRWEDIDCYARSLRQSGFEGDAVMIVYENSDNQLWRKLEENRIYMRELPDPRRVSHFQTWRYIPATYYLREVVHKYRFVMWTDVCDLVFQKNPMEFLEANQHRGRLCAAKEGRLIKNEGINTEWMKRVVPDAPSGSFGDLEWHMDREVLCSGTIQGEAREVLALFETMVSRMNGISNMQGIDQGIYNWAMRQPRFAGVTYTPEMDEAFISTCGMFLSAGNDPSVWTVEHPYFDREVEKGTVWNNARTKMFSVQHCYNRHHGLYDPNGDWRSLVESRYRA